MDILQNHNLRHRRDLCAAHSRNFGLEAKALRVGEEGVSGATASLVRSAEFVLAQLGKAAERLEHAAVATEKASERPTYDQRNAKFLTVDAESRARRRRNGETLARQRCER